MLKTKYFIHEVFHQQTDSRQNDTANLDFININ